MPKPIELGLPIGRVTIGHLHFLKPCPFCASPAVYDVERGGTRKGSRWLLAISCVSSACFGPRATVTWVKGQDDVAAADLVATLVYQWQRRARPAKRA